MAGRTSKPTELILLEGKSHRTKAEIEYRKQAEETLYTGENFKETKQVKNNKVAHTEFLRLKRLYSKISFVDALDEQVINRYCLEISNQFRLEELLDKLEDKLDDADIEPKHLISLAKSISSILSNINKSKELLLKYEDRLFLNPAGRMRSIPKTPPKKEEKTGMAALLERKRLSNGKPS